VGLRIQLAPDLIECRPVTVVDAVDFEYASSIGCTIRQISQAQIDLDTPGRVVASVRPSLVPQSSMLAHAEGSKNLIVARGHYGGDTVYSGAGAGGGPTAVAVVSDLAAIAAIDPGRQLCPPPAPAGQVDPEFVTPHYVRFVVRDRPGIIAALANIMASHEINIDAVLQHPAPTKEALPFVMTVEPCTPATLGRAMREIAALDFHVQPPVDLPILTNGSGL